VGLTADDIMAKLLQLEAQISELKSRIVIDGDQVKITEGLSDIDDNLGCITAGEFRAGIGTPGHGFTGTRIAYPPMRYNTKFWHIAGVDNDEIQWGANSTSGKIMAGAGAITLDAMGVRIKTEGIANYHRRPMSIWHPGDSLEFAMRIRDPDINDCDAPGLPRRQANLIYRAPGTVATYPFWSMDYQQWNNDTTAGTDAVRWQIRHGIMPTSTGTASFGISHYTGQAAASDNKTQFAVTKTSSDEPVEVYLETKTQHFEILDADTTSASAEGWIEIKIGSNVSYIRTYDAK